MSTRRQRQLMRAKRERLQNVIVRPFIRKMVKEKNRYLSEAIKEYIRTGLLGSRLLSEHEDNMQDLFVFYGSKMIFAQGGDTLLFLEKQTKSVKAKRELTKEQKFFLRTLARTWLAGDLNSGRPSGLANAKAVAGTTKADLRRQIEIGIKKGENPKVIADRLIKTSGGVKSLSLFRAQTIAHTEVGSAQSFVSDEVAQDVQRTTGNKILKRWVPTPDLRTRDHHSLMDFSEWISLDDKFFVGDQFLNYPRDTANGNAANVINCRCESIQEEEEFV